MIRAEFHPDARIEMTEAAGYYESQSAGLGKRFLQTIHSAIRHIQLNPTIYQQVESNIRRARVSKFPFGVIFRNWNHSIEIVAIVHFKQRPGYWKDRIKSEQEDPFRPN